MQLSTSLNVFDIHDSFDMAINRCKRAGFKALDFNYWDHQGDVLNKTWEEEEQWARAIRSAADSAGLRFTQMHGPVHGTTFSAMVSGLNVETFLELAKRSLRTASILGIPWVVFHPTHVSSAKDETIQEAIAYNRDFFSQLIPVLEETRVGIALENLRRFCGLPEELVELIDSIDHPLVGACWDTGHAQIRSVNQYDAIKRLGHRLKATHIQDNNGEMDQHFLPYHGSVNWDDVLSGLRAIDYSGDFTYEIAQAIRVVPMDVRDDALQYAVKLGEHLLHHADESL